MKGKYIILFLLPIYLLATGCKKYLLVQPEGSYTEDQVFRNEMAVQQALNGLYLDLGNNNLYGAALTQTYIEILAQQYRTPTNNILNWHLFQGYQYSAEQTRAVFESIWQKAYSTILATNVFLVNVEKSAGNNIVSDAKAAQMKGEALAIRAMIHFDILRLFAPAYAQGASQSAIPYYAVNEGKQLPVLTGNEVVQKILADLNEAAKLLQNDMIKQSGVTASADFYSGLRNQRMNYYAVEALKARVYLWAGMIQQAHDAAYQILNEGEKWFPWMNFTEIKGNSDPNRIFSPELLLAVYNPSMYTNYTSFFAPAVDQANILTANAANLRSTFENNENDYRYTTTWLTSTTSYPTFYKYADAVSKAKAWRFLQPMFRKSELYYILAETETDPAKALNYLNQVRINRGLQPLISTSSMRNELTKEHRKEFYGEGQLFFYYKRIGLSNVVNANSASSTVSPVYTVPLPLSETTPR